MTIKRKSDIEEIEMDLVGTCNLSCPLCTRNYAHADHMDGLNVRHIDTIIEQLDSYPNLQRFFVAGAVSEPTMYKYFLEFIEYLNSRNIHYEIFTNGNTHSEAWWEKLGTIVREDCKVEFTICGSTQELHEKYRVGSSLDEILRHATAYRKAGKNNDWIQHIRFEYNKEDLESEAMQDIINEFSFKELIETEGRRRQMVYNDTFEVDIRPVDSRERAINTLFDNRPKPGDDVCIDCLSIGRKKVYINQFGKVSACYTHAENEDDWFEDDDQMDYTDILDFKYPDCFGCERKTKLFIDKLGLEFIC
jgi:MoaA/NifB/PqqE/SkfB family radical SAM enzyme